MCDEVCPVQSVFDAIVNSVREFDVKLDKEFILSACVLGGLKCKDQRKELYAMIKQSPEYAAAVADKAAKTSID